MNRRWIRIDRAHTTFDCSPREFEAFLSEARAETENFASTGRAPTPFAAAIPTDLADESMLLESINAELAVLAALQRRDRISRLDHERSDREAEKIAQGNAVAELHAATLGSNDLSRPT